MACNHKFIDDLSLTKIDFVPTTLIVGTFNPAWPKTNTAEWFYGRTQRNYFWNVLPRLYGDKSLIQKKPEDWKSFCKEKQIALTDLITSIQDADETKIDDIELLAGYSDKAIATGFKKFDLTDTPQLLKLHPSIKNVYLTRSTGDPFWRKLWSPAQAYTLQKKNIRQVTLITPSGYAYYQQGKYNNLHPESKISVQDFILMKWKESWHKI